jgi:hypothetical protein
MTHIKIVKVCLRTVKLNVGRITRQGTSLINVTAVIMDRSAGWNDLVVEQRVQSTDTGTYWKGATLNTGRVLVNNAKNIECA